MVVFYNIILRAINDYKALLRKNLSSAQCAAKVRALGIKRKNLKDLDEVALYDIGMKILAILREQTKAIDKEKLPNYYHGTEEFAQYLEKLFSEYKVEDGKVVHVSRKASHALVAAIQMIALPEEKISDTMINKISEYANYIYTYGNQEQKQIFHNAVHHHKKSSSRFSDIGAGFTSLFDELTLEC